MLLEPSGPATGASLPVLPRVRRLCEGLGIALTLTVRPRTAHTPPVQTVTPGGTAVPEPEVQRS